MTPVNSGTKKENKEVCVLIRIKPKYTEEFCIMMIACKELCKRVSKFKKVAKIDEAFSVLGPFDFLLELSEKKYLFSWNDTSENIKKFLIEDFDVRWGKDLEPTWDYNTIDFSNGKNKITLNMKRDKVILSINDERTCEFVKKDGGTDIYRKEEEVDERINRTIFNIRKTLGSYIYETHTLTKIELPKYLEETSGCKKLLDIAKSIKINGKDTLNEFKIYLKDETPEKLRKLRDRLEHEKDGIQKNKANKIKKHMHLLIKVKPDCTEKFFLTMTIFKSLCNDPASRYLAEIPDTTCSIFGPFDFIFELIAKGAEGEEEEMTEKITRTIFEIRETLGNYIYETHTIEKFKIPMTKEDLKSFFKKKIGEEYLVRLPHCDGEKVPHERHKPHDKIDLKEFRYAETTALKKLLENAKTFLEPENLEERIIDLNSRVEELEKR